MTELDQTVRARPVAQWPEPSRLWIGHSPRTWRLRTRMWTNLAGVDVGGMQKPSLDLGFPELDVEGIDDLLYIPPVERKLRTKRTKMVSELAGHGTPMLVQLVPGEKLVSGVHVVFDLMEPLVERKLELMATLPKGAVAVWPLIPAISDHPETWDEGLDYLEHAGIACVQGITLDLTPQASRRLAEGRPDEVFDALFHSRDDGRVERAFAERTHKRGIKPFFPRPVTGSHARTESNRAIAAQLALAGEVWLRLDRSPAAGQAMFRAARGAEATHRDLAALVREENLKVLDWLDPRSQVIVDQFVKNQRSEHLEHLLDQYLRVKSDDGGVDDLPTS